MWALQVDGVLALIQLVAFGEVDEAAAVAHLRSNIPERPLRNRLQKTVSDRQRVHVPITRQDQAQWRAQNANQQE